MIVARVFLVLAAARALTAQTPDPRETAKQLVARVDAKFAGQQEVGGGIIAVVAPAQDRIYIVTANHVVRLRDASNTPAQEIKVTFKWLPESFTADLMEHFDKSLDLAVLRVRGVKEIGLPTDLPVTQVGFSTALRRESKVYTLGFPNGKPWFLSASPDAVSETRGDSVQFQSGFLAPGHSGGVLLNDQYQAVALILEDSPPESKALRIENVLSQLRDWNYTPSLRPSVSSSGPTRRVLRLLYVEVIQDGSTGSTRWDFGGTVNGKRFFDWRSRMFDDDRTRNRVTPDPGDAVMEIEASGDIEIEIKGDHSVGASKPATGKQIVKALGQSSFLVKASPERDGLFNFVFSLEEKKN